MRPFGVSSVLAGFDTDGKPQVFQIDPSGTYFAWKANAIGGRNFKNMREFLEKEWTEGLSDADALKLNVKTLLEVVDAGAQNMQMCVIKKGKAGETVSDEALTEVIKEVEAEKEEAKAASPEAMET